MVAMGRAGDIWLFLANKAILGNGRAVCMNATSLADLVFWMNNIAFGIGGRCE